MQEKTMYSLVREDDTHNNATPRRDITLPKLPPLDTRRSFFESEASSEHVTPITKGTSINQHDGSSPGQLVSNSDIGPNNSLFSNLNGDNISPYSKRSSTLFTKRTINSTSPNRTIGRRRPPPPLLTSTSSPLSRTFDTNQTDNLSNTELHNIVNSLPISPIDQSFNDIPSLSESFPKPLAIPNNLRNISGLSRVSESIESYYSDANYIFNNSSARHSSYNSLLGGRPLEVAPSVNIPTQPFSMSILDENKLYQCYSVYRLSDVYEWILKVYFEWFTEYIFGQFEFYQMIQRLLEFQISNNFDQDVIDSNVDKIINSLLLQDAIRFEPNTSMDCNEEKNEITNITIVTAGLDIQGIFTELLPCYSFDDSTQNKIHVKCYSTSCQNISMNTPQRDNIQFADIMHKSIGVWADYWHLTPEDLDNINPKDIQKQSFIFDLIMLEERSLNMANAAVEIYGKAYDPDLLPDEPEFSYQAFDVFRPLIELHTEYLLDPITWKIKTKGKFISGIGKLYLKWCHEAHIPYLNYAKAMATVHEIINWEKKRKTKFSSWLKAIDNKPEITRSKMYYDVIFFGGFFKSLQNLPITLKSILTNTDKSDEDYDFLKLAIAEVQKLSSEVDKTHGEAIDHRNLIRFSKQLIFDSRNQENTTGYSNISSSSLNDQNCPSHSSMIEDRLELGLINDERKLILSGPLLKKRDLWLDPAPVYIALLDNYLLITEITMKDKRKWYKLIERPIPIDYLNVERKKETESRNSWNSDQQTSSILPDNVKQTPLNTPRANFLNSAVPKTIYSTERENSSDIKLLSKENGDTELSFKIRNTATNESFTFLASSSTNCEMWTNAILTTVQKAKERDENIADFDILTTHFAYSDKDAPANLPVAVDGSEIDVALKKYEVGRKENINFPVVCNIFASTIFTYERMKFLLVACDYGILIRIEDGVDRQFKKILQCNSVSMMEVNHKLGLLFVIENHNLLYFSLVSILGAYYDHKKYLFDNSIVGIVIRDKVDCFKFAEDFGNSRHLLFARKGKIHVLTPEFDQINKTAKYFKEYKQYKLPSSLLSLDNLSVSKIIPFMKSFLVCTSKGIILFLDEFGDEGITLPMLINEKEYISTRRIGKTLDKGNVNPSLNDIAKLQNVENIIKEISSHKLHPINCFKLKDSTDFIIVYNKALVRMNCNGKVVDYTTDVLSLDFTCENAILNQTYMILTSENLIQVYDINKVLITPLKKLTPSQIIKGKKIQLLNTNTDDNTVILDLSHPNIPNRQLLLKCNIIHP